MVRTKRCEMNISENAGSSWRTRIMADFSNRMISHSVIASARPSAAAVPPGIPRCRIRRDPRPQQCLLPLLGNDGDLDLTLLDVEHRIRRIALREDNFIRPVLGQGSATIYGGEKYLRVKIPEWSPDWSTASSRMTPGMASDAEMEALDIRGDTFHPECNYAKKL